MKSHKCELPSTNTLLQHLLFRIELSVFWDKDLPLQQILSWQFYSTLLWKITRSMNLQGDFLCDFIKPFHRLRSGLWLGNPKTWSTFCSYSYSFTWISVLGYHRAGRWIFGANSSLLEPQLKRSSCIACNLHTSVWIWCYVRNILQ